MAHAWAPPIDTLTLFDITGEPAVEGQEPPECQICMERLYNPEIFPSETDFTATAKGSFCPLQIEYDRRSSFPLFSITKLMYCPAIN